MRILYLLTIIYISLSLTSCTSVEHPAPNPVQKTIPKHQLKKAPCADNKSPIAVSFYTKTRPKSEYIILGQETISKFNDRGYKRQEAFIRDGMRELAAGMGGDAIIDIKHDAKTISATVIAFKKNDGIKEG